MFEICGRASAHCLLGMVESVAKPIDRSMRTSADVVSIGIPVKLPDGRQVDRCGLFSWHAQVPSDRSMKVAMPSALV